MDKKVLIAGAIAFLAYKLIWDKILYQQLVSMQLLKL